MSAPVRKPASRVVTKDAPQTVPVSKLSEPSSKRAQGWHAAVDTTKPSKGFSSTTSSILRQERSARLQHAHTGDAPYAQRTHRPSVQFTADTKDQDGFLEKMPLREKTAFRQNMVDFLGTMYGDSVPEDPPTVKEAEVSRKFSTKSSVGRGDVGEMFATTMPMESSRQGGDKIDILVDKLVRAYSSKAGMMTEGKDTGTQPVRYYTKREVSSGPQEISNFVSQAFDSIIPHSNSQRTPPSNRSMLTSLGLDESFAHLLSFQSRTNLVDDRDDDKSVSAVKPLDVGDQAMFRTVVDRPNVSGSLEMRGPLPNPDAEATGKLAQRYLSLMSEKSSMSLYSGATEGSERSDTWSKLDAQARAVDAGVTRTPVPPLNLVTKTNVSEPATHLVNGTRCVQALSRQQMIIRTLINEEELSRNVILAVEQQLRGYMEKAHHESTIRSRVSTPQRGRLKG